MTAGPESHSRIDFYDPLPSPRCIGFPGGLYHQTRRNPQRVKISFPGFGPFLIPYHPGTDAAPSANRPEIRTNSLSPCRPGMVMGKIGFYPLPRTGDLLLSYARRPFFHEKVNCRFQDRSFDVRLHFDPGFLHSKSYQKSCFQKTVQRECTSA